MTSPLRTERAIFLDVLLAEDGLQVEDSYHNLPQKTTSFLQWTLRIAPSSLHYVMMVDDDVYVDMPGLVDWLMREEGRRGTPLSRFYAGEVCVLVMNVFGWSVHVRVCVSYGNDIVMIGL